MIETQETDCDPQHPKLPGTPGTPGSVARGARDLLELLCLVLRSRLVWRLGFEENFRVDWIPFL